MKQIGAVIDNRASQIRVPLLNDITKLPIVFRPPTKSVPSTTLANQSNQKAAFMSLPNINGLVSVMTTFNPKSPWLGHARQLANNICAYAATGIPPSMGNGDPTPTVILCNNFSGGNIGHPDNQTPDSNGAADARILFAN